MVTGKADRRLRPRNQYVYDADDEQTKVEAANGTTTETAYDSMGAVKSKTNGNGKTTEYN